MTLPFDQIDSVFGAAGPGVIVEVGAADGLDTARYAQRYPQAMIDAFEPLERNIIKLNAVAVAFAQVTVFPVALSDASGVRDFWESGGAPAGMAGIVWPYSSSLLQPLEHLHVHPWCTFSRRTIRAERFDSLAHPGRRYEYAHLDVQGAELEVLRGFGTRLKELRGVWMEVSTQELYAKQPLYEGVNRFMCAEGFFCTLDTAIGVPSGDQFWRRT